MNSPFDKGGSRGIKIMRAGGVLSLSFVKEGFLHASEYISYWSAINSPFDKGGYRGIKSDQKRYY